MQKSGIPGFCYPEFPKSRSIKKMDLVKLGKKGQVTIPKGILRKLAIPDEAPLVVEASADGAIILRQAVVFPVEIYGDTRVKEFTEAAKITPREEERVQAALMKRKAKKR
jgi:AbrB family looped-hinge helix DNA binding protein